MIPAEELLKLLQERDLVPPEVIQQLRKQASDASRSPKPLSAAMAAKILVDQGYLSRLLAQRLMTAVEKAYAEKTQRERPEPVVLKKVEPPQKKGDDGTGSGEDEVLELAPLDEADDLFGTAPKRKTRRQRDSQEDTEKKDASAGGEKRREAASEAGYSVAPDARQKPDASLPVGPENLFEDLPLPVGPTPAGTASVSDPFASLPRRRNVWDSPLLLLGGGALLLLVFVGVIVLFSLNRRSGDELLSEAEADYRAGSYTQAIHKYQRFLKDFPKHPQAGVTRVRVGLAQIRQTLSGDWLEVWQNTRRVLDEIAGLPDFHPEADAELTAILPTIGEGLAASAFERADAARIEAAEQVLSAIRRYVPRENRPSKQITDIENTLQLAKRRITLNQERAAALAKLQEARGRGAADEAYEIRRQLVRQFPQLADDPELAAEMSAMCDALRDRVEREDLPSIPAEAEPEKRVEETAFFAQLREGRAPVAEDQFILVEAEGCVFCLSGTTGQLIWQRYVGTGSPGGLPPTELPWVQAGGVPSTVILDHRRHALVWIELATGKEIRTVKMPGETAWGPIGVEDRIFVGGADARWFVLDAATGEGLRTIRFPVAVRVSPAVSSSSGNAVGSLWFAAAEHSYTFALSESGRKTAGVIYTGHERGSLILPPVVMDRYLLLPEVLSNDATRIGVWRWSEDGRAESVQQVAVPGRLAGPLQVSANRLLFETAGADVLVFELRGDPKSPLVRIAEGKTASPKSQGGVEWEVPRYVLLESGILIAADTALTRFDLQTAAGRIVPQWVAAENMPTVQPPRIVGDAIFHVYRRVGQAGVFVAAISVKDGSFYWETRLADPLSCPPSPEDGAFRATTVGGAVCLLPLEEPAGTSQVMPVRMVSRTPDETSDAASRENRLIHRVPLSSPGIEAAAVEGDREVEIREADAASVKVRRVPLPMEIAGPIVLLASELIVPLRNGSLARVDWVSGRLLGNPYQTPVTPGKPVRWTSLFPLPDNRVAASREDGRLWLLSVRDGDWTADREIALRAPLIPPAAVLKTHLFAMDRGRRLTAVNWQTGETAMSEALDERAVWGPFAFADRVWLGTAKGSILAWDDEPKRVDRRSVEDMPWVGPPVAWRNYLLTASSRGELLLWDGDLRTIVDRMTLSGRPVAGPGIWQDWLMVGMRDGRTVRVRLDRLAEARP
ncbi:MAG: hypothetical protein Kow0040_04890 [Thermogutta sp.]